MLTARLNAASVQLCFICLLALTSEATPQICPEGTIALVDSLVNKTDLTLLDSRLYTPTIEDYGKCPYSTIKCFAEEFKVLIQEFDVIALNHKSLETNLQKLASKLKTTPVKMGCPECEISRMQSAKIFIEHLLSTLHAMNSALHCQILVAPATGLSEKRDDTGWK